jgi:GLPGLI family protein
MKKVFTFLLISTFVLVQAQKTKNSNQTIKVSYSKSYNGKLQENQDNIWIFSNSNETLITSEYTILQKSNFPYEQTLVKRDKNALLQITQLNKNASTSTLDSISLGKQSFELSDETKKILGYNCKKAKTIINSNTIELWYTNELNVNGAPTVLGQNLGLVLEMVRNGNFVISATKIEKIEK